MTDLDGAHVLVIGATGGLGTAVSRELVANGAALTLSGRSADRLAALSAVLSAARSAQHGDAVLATAAGDLVDPDFPAGLFALATETRPLTGVVFAAGVVAFGDLADLDDDVLDQLMLVNLMAPIRVARAAARNLPAGGFVLNISAVVAEQPMKGMAAYSATKAGVTAFDRAAAAELRRRRIRVVDVRPAHTETGLAQRPIAGQSPRLPTGSDPVDVARRIVRAILDDEAEVPSSAFGGAAG
ncbi:SDR family NAD(P)-dependent oxidoreductase [Nakamurella sp. GG22]